MSKRNLIALFTFITLLVVSTIFHYRQGENRGVSALSARCDTLVVYDTITNDVPIYVTKRIFDTIYIPVLDVVFDTDTIWAVAEREQVQWCDSLCQVYASGVQTQVDSVIHFIREREVTRYVTEKVTRRWGVGIQAGYGATIGDDRVRLSPYFGVGVTYNLFAW